MENKNPLYNRKLGCNEMNLLALIELSPCDAYGNLLEELKNNGIVNDPESVFRSLIDKEYIVQANGYYLLNYKRDGLWRKYVKIIQRKLHNSA